MLCVAVMLSVMVLGAGAAFSDQDQIENTEAVNMCSALNIIGGYEDGSFHPERNIKRSEITKMICVALNGGKEPNVSTNAVPTFSDVRGTSAAWAEGYIESCVAQGIVSGVGGGRFAPDGNVTAAQLAKMLLVSLGYNSDNEGFTGNAWETNVNVRAAQKGLYEGLETMDTSAAVTRDQAAQMVWNALQAYEVEYKTNLVTDENGNLITQVTVQDKQTIGNDKVPQRVTLLGDKYEAQVFVGTYDGNSDMLGIQDGRIQVTDNTVANPSPKYATYNLGLDWLGEEVKVLYKDSTEGVDGLDPKDTVYGVYNTGEFQVYNITKGDLQDAGTTNTANGKIKFGDKTYKVADLSTTGYGTSYVTVINNYGNTSVDSDMVEDGTDNAGAADASEFAAYINDPDNGLRVNSNDAIKFVCNTSGEIDRVYVINSQFGKISSLTSDKIAIEGLGTQELEDCDVYADAKVGDLVRLIPSYSDTVYVVEKAEATVTGTISAFKASDAQVQIDGNWYKYGANKAVASGYTSAKLTADDVDNTVELFVDGNYYFAYNKISGFGDYAVVTLGNEEFGSQRVKLLKADGTEVVTVKGDLNDGATLPAAGAANGKLFAYNLKSDNSEVDLSAKDWDTSTAYSFSFTDQNNTLTVDGGTKVVANDAAVFLYSTTDAKWRVYTADTLSDFNGTSKLQFITKDSQVVALAGSVLNFPTAGSDSVAYGYVTDRVDRTLVNGDKSVQLTVWNGENNVTVNVDGTSCTAYVGDFIEYPVVAEGAMVDSSTIKNDGGFAGTSNVGDVKYTNVKVKSVEDKRVITTSDYVGSDGKVVPNGTDITYVITDSTKIIGVNTDAAESSTAISIMKYTTAYGEDFNNAAIVYEIKTGNVYEIKAIFVDAGNKLIPYASGNKGTASGQYAGSMLTVTDGSAATKNGITATPAVDKTSVVTNEVVTVTVTLSGTASAETRFTVDSANGANEKITSVSGDAVMVDDTHFDVRKSSGAVSGTVTYTYEVTATSSNPSLTTADLYAINSLTKAQDSLTITATPDKEWAVNDEEITYTIKVQGMSAANGASDTITMAVTGADGLDDLKLVGTAVNTSAATQIITITANSTDTNSTYTMTATVDNADCTPTATYAQA